MPLKNRTFPTAVRQIILKTGYAGRHAFGRRTTGRDILFCMAFEALKCRYMIKNPNHFSFSSSAISFCTSSASAIFAA